MSLRLAILGVALAVTCAGCAHDAEWIGDVGAGEDAGIAVASEHGPVPSGYPVPVGPAVQSSEHGAWGEPTVIPAALQSGPQAVADSDGPYLLDTGDRLRMFVYGQPSLSRLYTVDHSGKITVPLIGTVTARGLTTSALERAVRSALGTQYVRDPQVTIDVQQNRPFFILGEVRNAGQYPYVSGMTVETAVAIAGGYTERASDRTFRLTRRINGFVEQIEAPSDYVMRPGDTVFVFERMF